MKSRLTKLFLVLMISGCASLPSDRITEFNSEATLEELVQLLSKQSVECWTKPFTMTSDARSVNSYWKNENNFIIVASHYAPDYGNRSFMVINVKRVKDSVVVKITESFSGTTLLAQPYFLNFTDDVKVWMGGDTACQPKESKLL